MRIKLEHEAERWREQLITSPAALDEFINQYQPDVSILIKQYQMQEKNHWLTRKVKIIATYIASYWKVFKKVIKAER